MHRFRRTRFPAKCYLEGLAKSFMLARYVSAALALAALTSGCRSLSHEPTISFSLVPVADPGGPESLEAIRGVVQHGRPEDQVVLYSYSAGSWWVQPFASRPFTSFAEDLSFQNSIHLGEQYATLLMDSSY